MHKHVHVLFCLSRLLISCWYCGYNIDHTQQPPTSSKQQTYYRVYLAVTSISGVSLHPQLHNHWISRAEHPLTCIPSQKPARNCGSAVHTTHKHAVSYAHTLIFTTHTYPDGRIGLLLPVLLRVLPRQSAMALTLTIISEAKSSL